MAPSRAAAAAARGGYFHHYYHAAAMASFLLLATVAQRTTAFVLHAGSGGPRRLAPRLRQRVGVRALRGMCLGCRVGWGSGHIIPAYLLRHIRTYIYTTAAAMDGGGGEGGGRKRVVFLGTPDVAARTLELLLQASRAGRCAAFCACVCVVLPWMDTRTGWRFDMLCVNQPIFASLHKSVVQGRGLRRRLRGDAAARAGRPEVEADPVARADAGRCVYVYIYM